MNLFRTLAAAMKHAAGEPQPTSADHAHRLVQRGDDQLTLRRPLDWYHQAYQLFLQLDDPFHQASTLGRLGNAYLAIGNRELARSMKPCLRSAPPSTIASCSVRRLEILGCSRTMPISQTKR